MAQKGSPLIIRTYFLVLLVLVKALFGHSSEATAPETKQEPLSSSISSNDEQNNRICVFVNENGGPSPSGILCLYELSSLNSDGAASVNEEPYRSLMFDRLRRTVDWSNRLKRPPMPFRIGGGLRSHSNRRIIIESL